MSAPATAADQPWIKYARELVGLKEIVGSRHEAKILQFFAEAGHPGIKDDETAWCAAFANAMLRRAGYAGTGSLAARSFLTWGEKLDKPKVGCVVVFKRGNSTWQGHVGFVVGIGAKTLQVLGGNQGNAVNIQTFPIDSTVLGYRWPLIKSAPASVRPVIVAPAKPPEKASGAAAGGAAAGAVVVAGGAAAVQQGVSALEVIAWIGGLTGLAVAIFITGYRIVKGAWPWTGKASPEPSLLSPPQSGVSLELASAQLALSSEVLPVTPSPQPSASKPRRKPSAKPSRKTPTPRRSSSSSKPTAAKKSSRKPKSKSKG